MIVCIRCGAKYEIQNGIPILVRNWQQHRQEIEEAKALKPGWYIEEQPPEEISPWRHHLRKRRLFVEHAIQRYLDERDTLKVGRILDLGCGDGNHLAYLKPYTSTVYGSDYNFIRLLRSQQRMPEATLFLADILDYPVLDGYFDIVFLNHVIEHISNDLCVLETVYRILAPGGLLILGTPNEGAWWWQLAYRLQPQTRASTDHVHFYTAKELGSKLAQTGFDLIEIKHIGWGLPHWGLDGQIRKYKMIDDAFEVFGKMLFPKQASSLYALAKK
jgi:SAM-dependent methyltransferase